MEVEGVFIGVVDSNNIFEEELDEEVLCRVHDKDENSVEIYDGTMYDPNLKNIRKISYIVVNKKRAQEFYREIFHKIHMYTIYIPHTSEDTSKNIRKFRKAMERFFFNLNVEQREKVIKELKDMIEDYQYKKRLEEQIEIEQAELQAREEEKIENWWREQLNSDNENIRDAAEWVCRGPTISMPLKNKKDENDRR